VVAVAGSQPAYVARIVHSTPGRLRLRLPRQALAEQGGQPLHDALAKLKGVQQVRIGREASSLLVRYDPAAVAVEQLTDALHRAGVHVTAAGEREPLDLSQPTVTSQVVNRTAGRLNERVAVATYNLLDLRTLVPIGLGVLALREILLGRLQAAPWYTLLWWTFDSYLKLRQPAHGAALPPPPPGPYDQ
jgi:copper chaperone CopZ